MLPPGTDFHQADDRRQHGIALAARRGYIGNHTRPHLDLFGNCRPAVVDDRSLCSGPADLERKQVLVSCLFRD